MSKIKYIVLLLLLTTACSPAQRIERITKRNPQLLERQTIIVRDTIVRPGINVEKTLIVRERDTVYTDFNKENSQLQSNKNDDKKHSYPNIKVRVIRDGDSLTIGIEIPPDTLKTEKPIDVDVVKVYKTKREIPIWYRLLIFPFACVALYCFLKWFGRKMGNHKQNGNV